MNLKIINEGMNSQKMIVVVARYNENLDWLKTVPWDYIVFNKGEDNLPKWIKNEIKLPNIGREAHTYLTYILKNYDNLPEYTIFLQGSPFDHSRKLFQLLDNFSGEDFYTLSGRTFRCDGLGRPKHPGLKLGESAQMLFVDKIRTYPYPAGAEFIVSKKTILFHTKLTYQKIMDFMTQGEISEEVYSIKRGRKHVTSSNLFSPWVMERLWMTLFDGKHKTIYDG